VAIGLVSSGGEEGPTRTTAASTTAAPGPPAEQRLTPVGTVARRVERIRDLRYRHIPRAHAVTPAQAARAGLADLDRTYPAARRKADEALLETLGVVPPRTDLRREIGAEFRDEVGGYYDPRAKQLAVVKGAATGGALGDIVLAHELNHALEDQRFGLHDSGSSAAIDDASLANTALVEGSATAVMYDYAQRFLDPGQALGDLLPALQSSGSAHLPRYLEDSLTWPYEGGLSFVNRLYARLHGWGLGHARWLALKLGLVAFLVVPLEAFHAYVCHVWLARALRGASAAAFTRDLERGIGVDEMVRAIAAPLLGLALPVILWLSTAKPF